MQARGFKVVAPPNLLPGPAAGSGNIIQGWRVLVGNPYTYSISISIQAYAICGAA